MFILGLVIVVVGVCLVLAGLFATDVSSAGQIDILGIDVSAPTLFVLGVIAVVVVVLGLWVAKSGAKRGLRQRREQKEMDELSKKLDRAEAGRDRDLDEDERDRRF